MKWSILPVIIAIGSAAHAQDAAQQQADPKLVATEAMLNQATAAHRDALAKMVELDRLVTECRKQVAQAAPKGEPAK